MTAGALAVTAADINAARVRLDGAVSVTPTVRSAALSEATGAALVVKLESLQHTGSFKERGACNHLGLLTAAERARGVLAVSAGNHTLAVAHHARRLGIPCTVVMPTTTPAAKVTPLHRFGPTIVLEGETFHDALQHGTHLAADRELVVVPPFDHPAVIAGQGTVGLELLDAVPDLDVLVVPVGGGGLIAGISVAVRAVRPELEIIGVQSEQSATLVRAPRTGGAPNEAVTVADGIAVKEPGVLTSAIITALVDDVVAVPEARIEEAIGCYLQVGKLVAEGAGAVGLAAVLDDPDRFRGRTVGTILSGANIDPHLLAQLLMRRLTRTGRLMSMALQLPDRPGALAAVSALLADHDANIVSVAHDRYRPELALRAAELEVIVETRDADHRAEILDALHAAGYQPAVRP